MERGADIPRQLMVGNVNKNTGWSQNTSIFFRPNGFSTQEVLNIWFSDICDWMRANKLLLQCKA